MIIVKIQEFFEVKDNQLYIESIKATELVKQYGSPLYTLSESVIRQNAAAYRTAMEKHTDRYTLLYASKAFLTVAMAKIMDSEGFGLDVVSGGELHTALQAGIPPQKIYMHGNNKTKQELRYAVEKNIGCIIVDNFYDIDILQSLGKEYNKIITVMMRVTPGIEAHTHDYIKTGQEDSKFGFNIEDGTAFIAIEKVLAEDHLDLVGFHSHIGSQIFEIEPYKMLAEVFLAFVKEVKNRFDLDTKELNLGGGLGINYTSEDDKPDYFETVSTILGHLKILFEKEGVPLPHLLMEPGRSIVGEAGVTLYTVGNIKEIPGIRKFVAVDGGMTDNPRPALYQAAYTAAIANRVEDQNMEKVTIAGKCCESGDILIRDTILPKIEQGDILAIFSTGAYNYSMSSHYNRIPKPPVVLVKGTESHIIVKGETYEDMVRNDLVPEYLK